MEYLVKTTEVYRVATVEEVDQLQEKMRNEPGYTLQAFSYKTKQIKQKGEVIEEYQLVTTQKAFNEEKDPCYKVEVKYEVE